MEILKRLIDKVVGGRYFLTIVTGVVFAYAAFHKILGADVIATIITMVFTLYFTKGASQKGDQK